MLTDIGIADGLEFVLPAFSTWYLYDPCQPCCPPATTSSTTQTTQTTQTGTGTTSSSSSSSSSSSTTGTGTSSTSSSTTGTGTSSTSSSTTGTGTTSSTTTPAEVNTNCCSETISQSLVATLEIDGVQIPIDWDGSRWTGSSAANCGDDIELEMFCDGSAASDFKMLIRNQVDETITVNTKSGTTPTCDPLDLQFLIPQPAFATPSCYEGDTITVTE